MSKSLKIAVAGLGTVGVGTIKMLVEQSDLLERRCGKRFEVVAVSARDKNKDRGVSLLKMRLKWLQKLNVKLL